MGMDAKLEALSGDHLMMYGISNQQVQYIDHTDIDAGTHADYSME